jgi:hypothetical protein
VKFLAQNLAWRTKAKTINWLAGTRGRQRVLLIAASILAARKLAQFEGGKRVPATMSAIADAVGRGNHEGH